MWNSYDLDQVAHLFVADDTVTYLRPGHKSEGHAAA
jgi:hypothetical protein